MCRYESEDIRRGLFHTACEVATCRFLIISALPAVVEPGPQAYTGVSGGVEHEKSIISYLNGKVGGIMFWAVNEGARAPNGKTTGENSVALANYAAAL